MCHGLRLRKDEREKLMVVPWVEVGCAGELRMLVVVAWVVTLNGW